MELGVFSFGDVQKTKNGDLGPTSEAITNLLEAIKLADRVGLDVFGVGEHHTAYFPASSPSTILAAAAATTKTIKLTSAVSVLSTDDPVRLYQQFSTANIISGGRVEIIAGRGSSTESFPLFGYDLRSYDALYKEKLELLLEINALKKDEPITWEGTYREPLQKAIIVPRSEEPLPIWLATGGNPESSIRAAALDLPIAYAIIGGNISRFAPLINLYRQAAKEYGSAQKNTKVAIATPGYIALDAKDAKDTFWKAWGSTMATLGKVRGFAAPTRQHYDAESNHDGSLFIGSPDEIADRIIELHTLVGHSRHIFQMDVGQLPHDKFLESIELLGTKVAPKVRKALKK
jgi:probable LLM family oxidoreductase